MFRLIVSVDCHCHKFTSTIGSSVCPDCDTQWTRDTAQATHRPVFLDLSRAKKLRLIHINPLRDRERFYDLNFVFPRPIKNDFEPVLHVAMLSFKCAGKVIFWKPNLEWKGMLPTGQDWICTNLTRNCKRFISK